MYKRVSSWINNVLSQEIPEQVRAFCFNLYDDGNCKWSIEIVGTEKFDLEDEDWPCYEVTDFGTRDNPFVWSKTASWESILEETKAILRDYLKQGDFSDVLKAKEGVGVGFVDGDIEVLYHK